ASPVAAPMPPSAARKGSPITAPTHPPAAARRSVDAPNGGDPPATPARPATARRGREAPTTARAATPQVGGVRGHDGRDRRGEPGLLRGTPALGGAGAPPSGLAPVPLAYWRGARARSRRGPRPALRPRSPGSTPRALGGGRHSGSQATPSA